jgi:hypothetical protein
MQDELLDDGFFPEGQWKVTVQSWIVEKEEADKYGYGSPQSPD